MKKRIVKVLMFLICLAFIIAGVVFYGMYVEPTQVHVTNETISNDKIPSDMNDVTVAFVSDIHYGEFVDENRLNNMVSTINDACPDIIVFGGDLFTNPEQISNNPKEITKVQNILKKLKAPLGKFYVLGECDLKSEDTKTFVSNLLYNVGFEDLTNKNIKVHNGSKSSVVLIGLDSMINGNPDINKAFSNVSESTLNIVFTHVPDEITKIPPNMASLALAGHSHGGQISLPIIGPLSRSDGSNSYESGIHQQGSMEVCISNGLGTTGTDMRLFSPPEVIIYRLEH